MEKIWTEWGQGRRTKFNITNETQQHQKLEQRNKMRQDKVNNASGLELSLCDHAREKVSRIHYFLVKKRGKIIWGGREKIAKYARNCQKVKRCKGTRRNPILETHVKCSK